MFAVSYKISSRCYRGNGSVQASFRKILTADYCVIRIVIDIFDIFTVVLS
jgi:hypothetical protein